MCGAVPAVVRSVSLYSPCGKDNITVIDRKVNTRPRDQYTAPYRKFTIFSLINLINRYKLSLTRAPKVTFIIIGIW